MNLCVSHAHPTSLEGRLTSISTQLLTSREGIEQEFLDMGNQLISCTQLLNDISTAYADMPRTLKSREFTEALESLETISIRAQHLASQSHETQEFLFKLRTATSRIGVNISILHKTTIATRYATITACIVAATIRSKNSDLVFFTDEMMEASKSLDNFIVDFTDEFVRMGCGLDTALSESRAFAAHQDRLLTDISTELAQNIASMEQSRDWAENQALVHAQRTESISSRVGKAVGALQIGDSTRQRIEHIEQALEIMTSQIQAGGSFSCCDHAATMSVACQLQAAQLEGTIDDFEAEIKELSGLLIELSIDAKAMLKAGNTDTKTLLSAGDAAFSAIASSLRQVLRMFEQLEKSCSSFDVTVENLIGVVQSMFGFIEQINGIEQQVKLISLNSAIQSVSLGQDGAAFRFIAQEMRALTEDMTEPTAEITNFLEEATQITQLYCEHRSARNLDDAMSLEKLVWKANGEIDAITARLHNLAEIMVENGPEAVRSIQQAVKTVADRRDFSEVWRRIVPKISGLTQHSISDMSTQDLVEGCFADFCKIYTMKRERKIHSSLLGLTEISPHESKQKETEASLDDILF